MDAYGIYKEFGEVVKAKKHSKLPDKESEYEADGESEVDLKHSTSEKEMLTKNKMVVTAFTLAFRENHDQYYMTMERPNGQAWEIIQDLQDEFAPTDMMGDAEQQRTGNNIHEEKRQS